MTETYTPPTITNYNDNPPDDDGTISSDNLVEWAKHIDEIGDPLKDYIDAVSSETDDAFERVDARNARSVLEFGVAGDGVTDDTAALANARSWLAAQSGGATLIFPTGTYKYSTSPNWGIQDCRVISNGTAILLYTGTGNAVTLDGGAAGNGVYNAEFGPFIVKAPSTADHGIYMRAYHHGKVRASVRGCGTDKAGIYMEWCVANEMHVAVSSNENGGSWYSSGKPLYGLYMTERDTDEDNAYNTFINPIFEGCATGMYLDYCIGNGFYSGTSEGNTTEGITLTANAQWNKFYGIDLEQNNGSDMTCNGNNNEFFGVDSFELITIGASGTNNKIFGGSHVSITVEEYAEQTHLIGLTYDRFSDSPPGAITDDGTRTIIRDLVALSGGYVNVQGRTAYNQDLIVDNPAPGGSPYTYTNNTGGWVSIIISGGTVSQIDFKRDSYDFTTGLTAGMFELSPSDGLEVTYSSVPDVYVVRR